MALPVFLLPWFAAGGAALYVLVRSAGVAVDRTVSLARHYDVPDALVAGVVVAVGTSLPEIAAHVIASLGILSGTLDYRVASATVLGGNMGSSTVQQTLLVGLFLVGVGRYEFTKTFVRWSYVPMVLASVLTLLLAWDGTVSRLDGLLLLGGYLVYLYYAIDRQRRREHLPVPESLDVGRDAVISLLALAAVVASAYVVLTAAQAAVDALALGGSIVGVVTIGVAAALPELSTVLESVRRDAPHVAMGTLVGSNVVNLLVGIGLGGTISTYAVPPAVVFWDLPFRVAVGAGVLVYALGPGHDALHRRNGYYLVALYFVFLGVHLLVFPGL